MMILIVGGAAQGKQHFAMRLGEFLPEQVTDGAVCRKEEIDKAAVLVNLEQYLRRFPEAAAEPGEFAAHLLDVNPQLLICCREVGSGIIPMDAGETAWREAVGRCCCALAAQSSSVYRMVCGLPQCIKGVRI